jgi:putative membrane protein
LTLAKAWLDIRATHFRCRISLCRKEKSSKDDYLSDDPARRRFFDMHDLIEGGIAILVLAGLLAVAAWGVTRILPSRRGDRAGSAEEILRERFARGEISAEEYAKAYQVLHETPSHRSYEDYVRDVMNRLRSGRDTGS